MTLIKYVNCQGVETKVGITCEKDTGTINPCNYTESPLQNDTGDEDGCVIHGSFNAPHIRMDPARPGVCVNLRLSRWNIPARRMQ